jgi:hypothetical protein
VEKTVERSIDVMREIRVYRYGQQDRDRVNPKIRAAEHTQ